MSTNPAPLLQPPYSERLRHSATMPTTRAELDAPTSPSLLRSRRIVPGDLPLATVLIENRLSHFSTNRLREPNFNLRDLQEKSRRRLRKQGKRCLAWHLQGQMSVGESDYDRAIPRIVLPNVRAQRIRGHVHALTLLQIRKVRQLLHHDF